MGGNVKVLLALLVGVLMVANFAEAQMMSKYRACEILCGPTKYYGNDYDDGGSAGGDDYDQPYYTRGRGLSAINLRPTRPPPPPRPPSQPSTKTDYIRYGRR